MLKNVLDLYHFNLNSHNRNAQFVYKFGKGVSQRFILESLSISRS